MSPLTGRRILVVEDEILISAMLSDMLLDVSAIVVGPVSTVKAALELLEGNPIDAAIIDMNLNGEWIDPVAEALVLRKIPFVFTTGYGVNSRSTQFGARTIEKPFLWAVVEEQLALAIHETQKPGESS